MNNDEIDSWLCDIKSSKDAAIAIKLTRELKAARKVVEAARVYFKQRHLECERICDVHPECDHCHLCEDDMVELSQTRSEIESLLKELGGEK